jgi:aromatic ring-opening dioxygenase LigB subunit
MADLDDRVALLCMGDGSARRSEKAPGWWDDRAEAFDATVAAALAAADLEALLQLDAELARALLVAGRASWQALAGAADGQVWRGELTHHEAPFGVGYLVAEWTRDE